MKRISILVFLICTAIMANAQSPIETLFEREAEYQHFSGSALITHGEEVIYKDAFGWAHYSEHIQNTINTPFDIGSLSKQFTGAAILHLVEEGDVELHQPANTYLGNYADEVWENVTIHHLLTHRSGIPSLFQGGQGLEAILPDTSEVTLGELISYFKGKELLFDPNDEYRYSNSGYILLAAVIEEVTGERFSSYMNEMFRSYGLSSTTFGPPEADFARPYYNYRSDLIQPAPLNHKIWAIGAGGVYSTVEDLLKWKEVIRSKQFLNDELRKAYLGNHSKKRNGYYAYGWEKMEQEDGSIRIQHDGANFGYISQMSFNPENGNTVILLTNQTYGSLSSIGKSANYVASLADKVWKVLEDKKIELLPEKTKMVQMGGTFEFPNGQQLTITSTESSYTIQGKEGFNPTRMAYHNPIKTKDIRSEHLINVANSLDEGSYWGMGGSCDWRMKLAVYSGLFSWGFGKVTEGMGKIETAVPAEINGKTGIIRLTSSSAILDVIVYFNDDGYVQGVFEHAWHDFTDRVSYKGFAVVENRIFLDGFPYGETDTMIRIEDDTLYLTQMGRTFKAERI